MDYYKDKDYLGDGVYVAHDGYQIWLTTERENRLHAIALEPVVLAKLNRYWERMLHKYNSERVLED